MKRVEIEIPDNMDILKVVPSEFEEDVLLVSLKKQTPHRMVVEFEEALDTDGVISKGMYYTSTQDVVPVFWPAADFEYYLKDVILWRLKSVTNPA